MGQRKTSLVLTSALLLFGGVGFGALASSLTHDSIKWRRPASFATTDPQIEVAGIDHAAAGRHWAQSAYPGGLRRCPEMNPTFYEACTAEMNALGKRPAFETGGYERSLLITTVEPPTEPLAEQASEPEPLILPAAQTADEGNAIIADRTPENYPAIVENTKL